MVFQYRWSLVTGSVALKFGTFCREYVVLQDRWSLMAVVSQDRFHCILLNFYIELHLYLNSPDSSLGTPREFSGKTSLGPRMYLELLTTKWHPPYSLRRRFRFVTYVRFAAYFQTKFFHFESSLYFRRARIFRIYFGI